jgi:hypothetical protein
MEDQGRQAVIACITLASFAIKALLVMRFSRWLPTVAR